MQVLDPLLSVPYTDLVATLDDAQPAPRPRCGEAVARYNAMADAIDAAQAWVPAMVECPRPPVYRSAGRRTG